MMVKVRDNFTTVDGGKHADAFTVKGTTSGEVTATVSATLNAPIAPTLIENSTYLISQSAPASIAADVEADAHAARDEVLSDRAAIDQVIIDLTNEMSLLMLQAESDIAQATADQVADNAADFAAATAELNADTATAQGKFAKERL